MKMLICLNLLYENILDIINYLCYFGCFWFYNYFLVFREFVLILKVFKNKILLRK